MQQLWWDFQHVPWHGSASQGQTSKDLCMWEVWLGLQKLWSAETSQECSTRWCGCPLPTCRLRLHLHVTACHEAPLPGGPSADEGLQMSSLPKGLCVQKCLATPHPKRPQVRATARGPWTLAIFRLRWASMSLPQDSLRLVGAGNRLGQRDGRFKWHVASFALPMAGCLDVRREASLGNWGRRGKWSYWSMYSSWVLLEWSTPGFADVLTATVGLLVLLGHELESREPRMYKTMVSSHEVKPILSTHLSCHGDGPRCFSSSLQWAQSKLIVKPSRTNTTNICI